MKFVVSESPADNPLKPRLVVYSVFFCALAGTGLVNNLLAAASTFQSYFDQT